MTSVGIRELKQNASAVLAKVRKEAQEIEITYRGQVIARIVPVQQPRSRKKNPGAVWLSMDDLARKIGAVSKQRSSSNNWRRDL